MNPLRVVRAMIARLRRDFVADAAGIAVFAPQVRQGEIIHLLLDNRRIWSFVARPSLGVVAEEWPYGLADRLNGIARFSLTVGNDRPFVNARVRMGASANRLRIEDAHGRPQVVNKWGGLTTTFASADPALGRAVIRLARQLVDVLQAARYNVAITSGTLLGWVRNRALLPNDDDADLAVVLTDSQSPADVAATGLRMRRELEAAGFSVLMHSAAHLQVWLPHDPDVGDAYCDIFLGFYRGEDYCQPFHLRHPVAPSSLIPPQTVELEGYSLPAPPVPEDWLAACYGDDWRTPNPAFTFNTPRSTRDRYENWFGAFNFGREFWDAHWDETTSERSVANDEHVSAVLTAAAKHNVKVVHDVGCGDGALSTRLSGNHTLIVSDFSEQARARASAAVSGVGTVASLNLADGAQVLQHEAMARSIPTLLSFGDVLHTLTIETRAHALILIRSALRGGGAAIATFPTSLSPRYSFQNPMSWHLPTSSLALEARKAGIVVTELARFESSARPWATVQFYLQDAQVG